MKQLLVDNAYGYCESVCREASTTFFSSFSALQYDKRRAVHAVYALCRWVDDIVDGDEEPSILETNSLREATDARQRIISEIHDGKEPTLPEDEHRRRLMALVDIRIKINKAKENEITSSDHPIFIALKLFLKEWKTTFTPFKTKHGMNSAPTATRLPLPLASF
jgi:phytoene/squalene synthetase